MPFENFVFKDLTISYPILTKFVTYGGYKCVLSKCYISLRKSFDFRCCEYRNVALKAVEM